METKTKKVTITTRTVTLSDEELDKLILKALDAEGGEVEYIGRIDYIDGAVITVKDTEEEDS